MDVICNECGKYLFSTDRVNLGGVGCEAQQKGFVYKNACLYSDKYNSLFFCNHECGKLFYDKNIPKNEKVTAALEDCKKRIPEMSKDVAQKMDRLVKAFKKINPHL